MSKNVPVSIYRDTSGLDEFSNQGVDDIVDVLGNNLVDVLGNQIVDTGVLTTQIPSTIWLNNGIYITGVIEDEMAEWILSEMADPIEAEDSETVDLDNLPSNEWRPTDGNSEFSNIGSSNIVDTLGNFLIDPDDDFVIDTGVETDLIPSSIWEENDSI